MDRRTKQVLVLLAKKFCSKYGSWNMAKCRQAQQAVPGWTLKHPLVGFQLRDVPLSPEDVTIPEGVITFLPRTVLNHVYCCEVLQ